MALMARSFSWSDLKLTALFAPVLVHNISSCIASASDREAGSSSGLR